MKKILIVNTHMEIGGIRRALLNLLHRLKDCDYSINLLLFDDASAEDLVELKTYGVNYLKPNYLMSIYNKTFVQQKGIRNKFLKILMAVYARIFGRKKTIRRLVKFSPALRGYDIAISFVHGIWTNGSRAYSGGCEFYVLDCVTAKKKIAWIHSDPVKLGFTSQICKEVYEKFDVVVNVSYGCKKLFDQIAPDYINKSKVIYNMFRTEEIRNLAECYNPEYEEDCFHIVTVARLMNQAKRIDRIIDCCVILKEVLNVKFIWHVIGDGKDKEFLCNLASEKQVDDVVVFEGKRNNPYPYMKHADLFVLPSDYEAFGITLIESMITGTPVLCTNFTSAPEIVQNELEGIVCDFEAVSLAREIIKYINNPERQLEMREYLSSKMDYNHGSMEQFLSVINELKN